MTSTRVSVQTNVRVDEERFALIVTTRIGEVTATTAIHRQQLFRRIGGIRFATRGSVQEVAHLASAMTYKCGAALMPFDGEKSLVEVPGGIPISPAERARIVEMHLQDVTDCDAGATLGPDMYAGEDVMSLVGASPRWADFVTGRSVAAGGLGIDSNGATALGLFAAFERLRSLGNIRLGTSSIQGFGAVGAELGLLLYRAGVVIRAISNAKGCLVALDERGLDLEELHSLRAACLSSNEVDLELQRYGAVRLAESRYYADQPEQIYRIGCDMFVPAARTMVIALTSELPNARLENRGCYSCEQFHSDVRPNVVLEGANYPLSASAERYLTAQGVLVLTDFLVNMGGVVGCMYEWAYLNELTTDPNAHAQVNVLARRWSQMIGRRNMDLVLSDLPHLRSKAEQFAQQNSMRLVGGAGMSGTTTATARARLKEYLASSIEG